MQTKSQHSESSAPRPGADLLAALALAAPFDLLASDAERVALLMVLGLLREVACPACGATHLVATTNPPVNVRKATP